MTVKLIFEAHVADTEDMAGLREQIGMCFEGLGGVRLVAISPVNGGEPLKIERGTYGHVMLSDAGYAELVRRLGKGKAEARINELSYKIHQKGYRFKDHFAVILEWDEEEERGKTPAAAGYTSSLLGDGRGEGKAASFDVDDFFSANIERGIGK